MFPLFADLKGRAVLVVGGGAVAERKTEALLRAGALPRLGAPALSPVLQQLADAGRIQWLNGDFEPAWLDQAIWLVIAATNDIHINRAVAEAAEARRLFVNVVDDAALSGFHVPAVVERGPLQIAISSGGGAPMVARHVRRQIEELFDQAWGQLAQLVSRKRVLIRERFPELAARRLFGDLYARLSPGAERWIGAHFEGVDGLLPETTPESAARLASLS